MDLLILAKTFHRTRFAPAGPGRGFLEKSRPMSANQAGHPAEGPAAWAHAVRVVKAEQLGGSWVRAWAGSTGLPSEAGGSGLKESEPFIVPAPTVHCLAR